MRCLSSGSHVASMYIQLYRASSPSLLSSCSRHCVPFHRGHPWMGLGAAWLSWGGLGPYGLWFGNVREEGRKEVRGRKHQGSSCAIGGRRGSSISIVSIGRVSYSISPLEDTYLSPYDGYIQTLLKMRIHQSIAHFATQIWYHMPLFPPLCNAVASRPMSFPHPKSLKNATHSSSLKTH